MTPVRQTVFDFTHGNCWPACIASILDLPLAAVPGFFPAPDDQVDWYRKSYLWLKERGYALVNLTLPIPAECEPIFPDGYVIVTGPSPRQPEKLHAVVGKLKSSYSHGVGHSFEIELIHDPHPSDAFFDGANPKELSFIFRSLEAA